MASQVNSHIGRSVAQRSGIDLIVLSTHGCTGMARVWRGSNTEKVVRHAKCPVLIVRQQEHEFVASGALEIEQVAPREEA